MNTQTVIVTGASSGIGKAIAQRFIKEGHNVIMNSSNAKRLEATFQEFGSPDAARLVPGDVSNPATGKKLVEEALTKYGTLDTLINNAGVFAPKPFLEVDSEDLDRFFNINLRGTYYTTQAAIAVMRPQGWGNIINLGTVLVNHALAGFPASAAVASKGAIHALTTQLAAEFGGDNIRVNTISPGIIRSPLQAKIGVDNPDDLAGLHLLGRIGEPEDVASTALYLSTADFVTGTVVEVAGGHVAGHKI